MIAQTICDRMDAKFGAKYVGKVAEDDPSHRGRGDGHHERRKHERERDRAEHHLDREKRAAQRHVVDGGHARARAARHEQAALPRGQFRPVRGEAREARADLLRRGLEAQRSAKADGQQRVYGARDRREQRQAAVAQPERLGDFHAPFQAAENERSETGDDATDGQREDAVERRGAFDGA